MEPTQPADPAPDGQTSDDERTPDDRTRLQGQAVREPVRSGRSPKDMVIALLVLLVPIVLLLGFYRVFFEGDRPAAVDSSEAVSQARSAGAFPVSEPTGLDSDWHTISADFRRVDGGATLRIGYVAPGGKGVQLVQSSVPADRLLPAELTGKARAEGNTAIGGRNWQDYAARPGEHALVLLESSRTVIVVGSAREEELRDLAGALR